MIQSMTAFARCSDQDDLGSATWEIRVVNHRYFDCSVKSPEAFRQLDSSIRLKLQKKLSRGRIDCSLKFSVEEQSGADLEINAPLMEKIIDFAKEVKNHEPMSDIDPMRILSWPKVLQTPEKDATVSQDMVLNLFTKTLEELVAAREREGKELSGLIKKRLQEVLVIVDKVKSKIPLVLEGQKQKIIKRLEEVVDRLDQSRLEQEMVYFAQKTDVTEEIDRLGAHVKEVLRILDEGGVVGKRLDFLMQELNREANTLASKSVDVEVTQFDLELKVLIEQMREQVQNIV